jgi:hypothetical protein
MSERDVNAEGLEKSFASNVMGESMREVNVWILQSQYPFKDTHLSLSLGVYILTKGLIPLLEKIAEPRVVSLKPTTHWHHHW